MDLLHPQRHGHSRYPISPHHDIVLQTLAGTSKIEKAGWREIIGGEYSTQTTHHSNHHIHSVVFRILLPPAIYHYYNDILSGHIQSALQ